MSTARNRVVGAVVAGSAVACMAALVAVVPAGAGGAMIVQADGPVVAYAVDSNPLNGVTAEVRSLAAASGRTIVSVHLAGFAEQFEGRTFGAHAHTGPCGATVSAGPHYTHDTNSPPLEDQEVWLDFTVNGAGQASAQVNQDWTFRPDGSNSVVIHADPTAANGTAGTRLGCMAVNF